MLDYQLVNAIAPHAGDHYKDHQEQKPLHTHYLPVNSLINDRLNQLIRDVL